MPLTGSLALISLLTATLSLAFAQDVPPRHPRYPRYPLYSHRRRYVTVAPTLAPYKPPSSICPRPFSAGELCAGAPGRDFVPDCGCEDGAACTGPPGAVGYGRTCQGLAVETKVTVAAAATTTSIAHAQMPRNSYAAAAADTTAEKLKGRFLELFEEFYVLLAGLAKQEAVDDVDDEDDEDLSVSGNVVHGMCHAVGARCMGAEGFPYVEFGDGCCEDRSECIDEDEVYGFKCSTPAPAGY